MKLIKTISGVGVLLLIATLTTGRASAQAEYTPALSATANGNVVTISWSAIAGAEGYELVAGYGPGGSDLSIGIPAAAGTHHVISAPTGTYFLRVRAGAGALRGPFSNEARLDVNTGPPVPCGTPAVPEVATSVAGPTVTVSWPLVPGATVYQVQFSRFPGGTELALNSTTNVLNQYIPLLGIFYVRVVAASPCGQSVSADLNFAITSLAGSGPRTPDPLPGQLLPRPTYGAAIVDDIARRYGGDLAASANNHNFLFRVVQALRQRDSRWGLNNKRGFQGLSDDIVAYNPTAGPDNGAQQIYIWDVISGHGGPNPGPNWLDVTDDTWAAGQSGNPGCGGYAFCARWWLDPYLAAGFPADPRQ
jgi:hypothetical protein